MSSAQEVPENFKLSKDATCSVLSVKFEDFKNVYATKSGASSKTEWLPDLCIGDADSKGEKLESTDCSDKQPAISVPQIKTAEEFCKEIDALTKAGKNPMDDQVLMKSLIKSVQARYAQGGQESVNYFTNAINENINSSIRVKIDKSGATGTINIGKGKPVSFDPKPKDAKEIDPKPIEVTQPKDPKADPVASVYGLAKALGLLKEASQGDLKAANGDQELAVAFEKLISGELKDLPASLIDGMASKDKEALNKFLKDHGYEIKIDSLTGIGVVTSTELQGAWDGKKCGDILWKDGKKYPAFTLPTPKFFKDGTQDEPVVQVFEDPNTGMKVYVSKFGKPVPGLSATELAAKMTPKSGAAPLDVSMAVALPMIDTSIKTDLSWLKGLKTTSGDEVTQAFGQMKIKMDEKGFKAKEGLAIVATRGSSQAYVFNEPFMFWVTYPGCTKPIFATVLTPEKK